MSRTFKTKNDPSYKIPTVRIKHDRDGNIEVVYKDKGVRVKVMNTWGKCVITAPSYQTIG